jgi:thioredoxin-like negative regulator of GroEL
MKSGIKVVSEMVAMKLIKSNDNLVIVHSKDGCPVCEHFIPEVLEPVLKDWPKVKVKMVKEQLTFPVGSHPVIYFFKNGKCVLHPQGSAPEKAVREMMGSFYGKPI